MSVINPASRGVLTPEGVTGSFLARWCAMACIALALSAGAVAWTGTASYEEQLSDIMVEQGFSKDAYEIVSQSSVLMRLLAEAAGDRELVLNLELALLKHRGRALTVLEAFGTDPQFQKVLRRHGDLVIPVIDYFMVKDSATLWAKSKLSAVWESISTVFGKKLVTEKLVYGPRLRGISAIETIREDGHHFLGQFVFDENGQAKRVQTDRVLEVLKKLFASGITDLESKYRRGDAISMPDIGWAGADVLSVFGATKAVAFLGKGAVSGKAVEEAAVVSCSATLMAHTALVGEKYGARVAKRGAKLAAVYLVVRHPSLLSGVFGALGKFFGVPAWLAMLAGWSGVAFAAMFFILPLLRGATLLISPIRWIAGAAAWIFPSRSRRALDPGAART
ncbi:MAG: hypothetical protein KKC85_22870 [Gammaproteobacteria bacterium]|nr:hypothetical protein [Gammaproteobacteria bacterium]